MINDLILELRIAYLNAIRKKQQQKKTPKTLTRKKESRDPFSIYSTTIITGRPANRAREHTGLEQSQKYVLQLEISSCGS